MIGFIFNNELKQIDSARSAYVEFLSHYSNSELAQSAKYEIEHLGQSTDEIFKAQLTDTTKKPEFSVSQKIDSTKK